MNTTWLCRVRTPVPGSARAGALADRPKTTSSISGDAAPAASATEFAVPTIDTPRTCRPAAPEVSADVTALAPPICTSGLRTCGSATPSTPTVPPVPIDPVLVSPTFCVWVVPSIDTFAVPIVSSGLCSVIVATPALSADDGIMKIDVSTPAGSACATPPTSRLPLCASVVRDAEVLAVLTMNWRSEPWPASLVLTIVEKLKPKSSPVTAVVPPATVVTACAVPLGPAVNAKVDVSIVALESPLPGSADAGARPPTSLVTATADPPDALVR